MWLTLQLFLSMVVVSILIPFAVVNLIPLTSSSPTAIKPVLKSEITQPPKKVNGGSTSTPLKVTNRELVASISSPWPTTPFSPFCETWGFLGDDDENDDNNENNDSDNNLQWRFLDIVTTDLNLDSVLLNDPLVTHDVEAQYNDYVAMAVTAAKKTYENAMGSSSSSFNVNLYTYALSLRSQTPLCELHRTLARDDAMRYGLTSPLPVAFVVIMPWGISVTDPADLASVISSPPIATAKVTGSLLLPNEKPRFGSKDHTASSITVILYGQVGTTPFKSFYTELNHRRIPFVVRHAGAAEGIPLPQSDNTTHVISSLVPVTTKTALQGYGVRLDIRNVEYRAFDDSGDDTAADHIPLPAKDGVDYLAGLNLTRLSERYPDTLPSEGMALQRALEQMHVSTMSSSRRVPQPYQRRLLNMKALSVIRVSEDPLATLRDLSQNLPSYASSLCGVPVSPAIMTAVEGLEEEGQGMGGWGGRRGSLPPFAFFVNGRRIYVERPSFNIFELVNVLREEGRMVSYLEQEFPDDKVRDGVWRLLLKQSPNEEESEGDEGGDDGDGTGQKETQKEEENDDEDDDDGGSVHFRVDVSSRGNAKNAIFYINDVEKDAMYAYLPRQVQMMLFGQPVRRNLMTALVVLRMFGGESEGQGVFSFLMEMMQGGFPLRVGVVFMGDEKSVKKQEKDDDDDDGEVENLNVVLSLLMKYAIKKYQPMAGFSFLHYLFDFHNDDDVVLDTKDDLIEFFLQFELMAVRGMPVDSNKSKYDLLEFISNNSANAVKSFNAGCEFVKSKGLKPGMGFLNGVPFPMERDGTLVPQKAMGIVKSEQQHLAGLIMSREITDSKPHNILNHLLKGPTVYQTYHPLLSQTAKTYLPPASQNINELLDHSPIDKTTTAVFLIEAYVDLESDDGPPTAQSFLSIMKDLPSSTLQKEDSKLTNVAYAYTIVPTNSHSTFCCPITSNDLSSPPDDPCPCPTTGKRPLPPHLQNQNVITVNGRALGGVTSSTLSSIDISILFTLEYRTAHGLAKSILPHLPPNDIFHTIAKAHTFLQTQQKTARTDLNSLPLFTSPHIKPFTVTSAPPKDDDNGNTTPPISVTAILDPLTTAAQRLSPLLLTVRDHLHLPLKVILLPRPDFERRDDVPLTSYYRLVADHDWGAAEATAARFDHLPTNHVLTLRLDIPESWNVQQSVAVRDTDNLRCGVENCGDEDSTNGGSSVTTVEYELNSLMFFGHCYDVDRGESPNGLQLVLGPYDPVPSKNATETVEEMELTIDGDATSSSSSSSLAPTGSAFYADTLVMKNLGYWQLRANPGVYGLSIEPHSYGAKIFDVVTSPIDTADTENNDGEDLKPMVSGNKMLIMKDFLGDAESFAVSRRKGFEDSELFGDDGEGVIDTGDDDVIHVFSLATGHLYERFLKIMMLSVTKRTSTRVKFWLFENFLSPSFKQSATAMAQRIGCDIQFVTYKWPEWLRGQSEKQRIIWGYKILFLDVLFPLSVKKIIYVDADQVVRGDLKELWDMDLQGAPYGYTPMCDSRESTLGFAFWRQGFWKSHLRGKPYHISALYVVDLERFRRELVGDQLRGAYQMLSADPNSLANLDQDLPNYAQHEVPIFSLPQEWLWCESWCSDETKAQAKTIDLCNNPLHKEPKVSMAKRVISGELFQESWIELDAEVEKYENEYWTEVKQQEQQEQQ